MIEQRHSFTQKYVHILPSETSFISRYYPLIFDVDDPTGSLGFLSDLYSCRFKILNDPRFTNDLYTFKSVEHFVHWSLKIWTDHDFGHQILTKIESPFIVRERAKILHPTLDAREQKEYDSQYRWYRQLGLDYKIRSNPELANLLRLTKGYTLVAIKNGKYDRWTSDNLTCFRNFLLRIAESR